MILYVDLSYPACDLAGRRADVLRAAGVDLDLCAMESQPRLPVTGRPTAVSPGQRCTPRREGLRRLP